MKHQNKTIITVLILTLVFSRSTIFASEKTTLPQVVTGNTQFALDLYQRLCQTKDNLIVSPYSISTALAMVYGGARGETEKQIAQALNLALGQDKLHLAFAELQASLNQIQTKEQVRLHIANSLWPQQTYPFLDTYLDLVRQTYGVNIAPVDYKTAREAARQQINGWVEQETASKIKDLLEPGSLNPLTRLVLVNAIYFKGNWALPFDKAQTRQDLFYPNGSESIEIPMMTQLKDFRYGERDQLQVLELPYTGLDLSMLILLPKKKDGLSNLEKTLNVKNLQQWTQSLARRKVNVFLPRFKIEAQFDLETTLKDLGITDAFSPAKANFSGMDGKSNWLYIGAAVHKAFIEVNEEGTEAAAATGITIGVTSIAPSRPKPVEFRADHPFMYIIRDNQTKSILFMGKVTDPT